MDKPSVTGMLDLESVRSLEKLEKELEHTFNNVQVHRTRTEMEVSVLDNLKHPTPASKYWQAMREQNVMLTGVSLLSFDYRTEVIRIKLLERKLFTEKDELKRELIKIKIDKKNFLINDIKRTAKNKIREIKEWSEIKIREADKMTEEELDNVDNHQLVSYTQRWINQIIVMGENGSPAERQNLLGQFESGINLCQKRKLTKEVLKPYKNSELMKVGDKWVVGS